MGASPKAAHSPLSSSDEDAAFFLLAGTALADAAALPFAAGLASLSSESLSAAFLDTGLPFVGGDAFLDAGAAERARSGGGRRRRIKWGTVPALPRDVAGTTQLAPPLRVAGTH